MDPLPETEETSQATGIEFGSSSAYDAASRVVASLAPVGNIHQQLCGFHVYAEDHTRQVEAHHFCSHKRPDFYQCIIYDSDEKDARLIGIEYVIGENVFKSLPDEEKKYWHSHKYEVESGLLYLETKGFVLNVINDVVEQPAMHELQKTYGKTVHTWAFDQYPDLPLGPPHLMVAYTADGQADHQLVQERDTRLGISTEDKKTRRQGYLHQYKKDDAADQWEKSKVGITFEAKEVDLASH